MIIFVLGIVLAIGVFLLTGISNVEHELKYPVLTLKQPPKLPR